MQECTGLSWNPDGNQFGIKLHGVAAGVHRGVPVPVPVPVPHTEAAGTPRNQPLSFFCALHLYCSSSLSDTHFSHPVI